MVNGNDKGGGAISAAGKDWWGLVGPKKTKCHDALPCCDNERSPIGQGTAILEAIRGLLCAVNSSTIAAVVTVVYSTDL